MLTVACVCVPGGIYDDSHTIRLRVMVERHLSEEHDFVIVMGSDKPGWWAKIDLFEPGLFKGRVLYLDLDVTVAGSLDDLVAQPYPFMAIRDYGRLGLNSSVMAWDAGAADHVYTNWTPDVMNRLHGDQNWITEQMPDAMGFPRRWVPSYKADVLRNGMPADARVVVYHGRPKPWDIAE